MLLAQKTPPSQYCPIILFFLGTLVGRWSRSRSRSAGRKRPAVGVRLVGNVEMRKVAKTHSAEADLSLDALTSEMIVVTEEGCIQKHCHSGMGGMPHK